MSRTDLGRKPGWRPWIIALVLLVGLDLLLRTPLFPVFPDDYRTPKATSTALAEFITWQGGRDRVRVAVVGDSVTQGYLMWRDQTYVAAADDHYDRAGRPVDVYNAALTAARGADISRVIERIIREDAADMIVVQFDYVFYADDTTETARYPDLFEEPSAAEAEPGVEQELRQIVRRSWKLAEYRDWIGAALFDGTPAAALRARLDAREGVLYVGGPHPARLAYDRINPAMLEKMWDVPSFTADNRQIAALREGLAAAQDAGVPVLVFIAPLNRDLGTYHGIYNDDVFQANSAFLSTMAAGEDARYVDLSDTVPPEHMIDSVHMLAPGHLDLATALVREIEPVVAAAEARRGGR